MKVLVYLALVLCCAMVSIAEEVSSEERPPLTQAQKEELQKKVQILKGGEKIAMPGTQRGTITIINAQSRASNEWIESVVGYLNREMRFNVVLEQGEFNATNPAVKGKMSIYVIDDESLPRSIIAPDDRWAYCNVAKVYSDKEAFFRARVKKTLSRTFAMLCGGMSSSYSISLVGPMPKVSDLDVIPSEQIPVDVTIRMLPYMEKFGVMPAILKPYKTAVQEGWAPAPTNDVQQAIWDKVHALPTEPIKIKSETTKQK